MFFDEVVLFLESEESMNLKILSTSQVETSLKEYDQMLMMFASLRVEGEAVFADLPVTREFSDVFPNDISDLPLEREVEFFIDFIPSTRLV